MSEKDFFSKLRFTRPAWITAVFLARALLQTLMMKISFKLFLPSQSFPLIHWPGAWEGRKCRSLKSDLSAPVRAVRQACSWRHISSCFGSKGQTGPGQMSSGGSFRYFHPFRYLRTYSDWLVVGRSAGVFNVEMSWFRTEVSIKQDIEHVVLVQPRFNIHIK